MSKFLKFIVHFVVICTIACILGLALPPFFGIKTVIVDTSEKTTNMQFGSVTYAIPVKTVEVSPGTPILVQKECCKKAFIRGAYLAAGSISDPNKFYHYEIVCEYEEDAVQLQELLLYFELDAKVIQRKRNYIV